MSSSILASGDKDWRITYGLSIASKHANFTTISLAEVCPTVPPDCGRKLRSRGAKGLFGDRYYLYYIPTTSLDSTEKAKVQFLISGVLNAVESELNMKEN